jgi:hypothetical protein
MPITWSRCGATSARSSRSITGSAGADLVRMSSRFFRTIHDQLGTGRYAPGLERDLQSAAGELAEVVGWLAYDAEGHDLARRMNQESLYCGRSRYSPGV